MVTNQFTIYQATDIGGPGYMYGQTGSLIPILDACLVNGYGTGSNYKAPAGWTKPLPNITSSIASGNANVFGCYQQGTGSMFNLFINDAGQTGFASECWASGWEVITGISASSTINAGFGINQFPLPAQSLTYGVVNLRKSNTADGTTKRYWMIAADGATMYMWIQTGDVNTSTMQFWSFGDCYSLAGPSDLWNCLIIGRVANSIFGNGTLNETSDMIMAGLTVNCYNYGHYIARNGFGNSNSLIISRKGDSSIVTGYPVNGGPPYLDNQIGILQCPNAADQSYYFSPFYIAEVQNGYFALRGTFRGLYQVGHAPSNFAFGQLISGSNDYTGKQFMMITPTINASCVALEVSPTLQFN